ncbi:MAG: zf-HC2 domain-containing protein [Bacteroidales bacterium]
MQCKGIHNDYIGYLDGTLDAVTKSRIEGHLLSCAHCMEFVSKLKNLQAAIDREKDIPVGESFFKEIEVKLSRSPKSRTLGAFIPALRFAASFALILLGTWMGLWIGKGYNTDNSLSSDYQTEIYYLYNIQQGIVENEMLTDLTK